MLPKINNKSFMECTESDLNDLLNNIDFQESQYIDYKTKFEFLSVIPEKKEDEITEFRNDICSFANADGGYILYGIKEKDKTPIELVGIDIHPNQEKFEMAIRNKLSSIYPKSPSIQFRFIKLNTGKYIVILKIEHDYFAPYIHIDGHFNYKIYKRNGINKSIISYTELKSMFIQSRTLEEEINHFRDDRIHYYSIENDYKCYALLHIIPESFLQERKQLFQIERKSNICFGAVFSGTFINTKSIPCVDGLRFIGFNTSREGYIYNNGTIELFYPLEKDIDFNTDSEGKTLLSPETIWYSFDYVLQNYQKFMPGLFGDQRYFVCISILGCKNFVSYYEDKFSFAVIDRNRILCPPIAITDINNTDSFYQEMKRIHLAFLLSCSIKNSPIMINLLKDLEK